MQNCSLIINERELYTNFIVLYMHDNIMILRIDWLSKYDASIDFKKEIVTFTPPVQEVHWEQQ